MPGPRSRRSIRARIHQRGRGAVLTPMDHCPLLDAVHTHGYAAIGIDQGARLTQLRVIEGLSKRNLKEGKK